MKTDIKTLIIYEDDQIIVCRKPAGIATQSRRVGEPDMERILKNHLALSRSSEKRPGGPYLAVIHRLDQPVEGLLVFAKTPAAARNLNSQLTGSGFGKYYLAIVNGIPPKPEAELTDYMIKEQGSNLSRICDAHTPGSKKAVLNYRTLSVENGKALLEISLKTGRHHQIRLQMSAMGCPISGDRKYGTDPGDGKLKLCAARLEFLHPSTKKKMHFEIKEPF